MKVYSITSVERYLRSYLDFQHFLTGQGGKSMDTYAVRTKVQHTREQLPLGMTEFDSRPWPFMQRPRAQAPRDGKQRAKQIQDIWVAMIDIEIALKELDDDDLELIYKYHVLQTHTLDELCAERGLSDRGAMSQRVRRAVERLVFALERPKR